MKIIHSVYALVMSSLLFAPTGANAVQGEVAIGGESLFIIRATVHGETPDQRADTVTERLPVILGDPNLKASDIKIIQTRGDEYKIMVKERLLVTVSREDGKINGISARKQAEIWAGSARKVLPMVNSKPNGNDLLVTSTKSGENDPAATMEVSGTVTYFQRIALPPDAILTMKIVDVTTTDRDAAVIAEKAIEITHQVPIAFSMKFDPGKIDSPHRYNLEAVIRLHGRPIWRNSNANPVITNGNPMEMQVMLAPVGARMRK